MGGAVNVSSPGSKPAGGSTVPAGASSHTSVPSGVTVDQLGLHPIGLVHSWMRSITVLEVVSITFTPPELITPT